MNWIQGQTHLILSQKKKSLHILGKQISIAQLHFTETIFLNKTLFKSLNSYLNLRESIIF